MRTNKELTGAILTTLGGICWGLSGSMGQYLFTRQGMDSRWLVPVRLGLAGIILLLYCARRFGRMVLSPWQNKTEARDLVIYGLLGVSCCQFLYFLTIQLSTAGAATILQDLSPIMILFVSCRQAKRVPKLHEILAIALALAGVFLITTHGTKGSMAVPLPAVITGVLSAIGVTIYNVTPQRLMRRYPVVLLQGWAFLMGGTASSLIFRPWHFGYVPNVIGLFGIAFVVLVGNVLAFPLYIQGVKYIGPEKAILYGFSEPISAAVVGTLFLGSPFTLFDAAGFALVFSMLALISLGGRSSGHLQPDSPAGC
ncbi:MAG: DMT family transporter [Firmicutes bacterium]|nr:DMT family transporter [Bacillota bacterium]